jgi:hypothetical protein
MLSVMQINGGRISGIVGRNTYPKFICEKAIGIKKKTEFVMYIAML